MTQKMQNIAVIGAGPAGLMAAEMLSHAGHHVTAYEAMPSVARKFLLAGKSGLNITHSEPFEQFANRFGPANAALRPALDGFTPEQVQTWAHSLGTETFVGTSGRVFPKVMKASPLLRSWLKRLEQQGVAILTRHRWIGFTPTGELRLETPDGETSVACEATLLSLGGASWPRLGSDAAWVPELGRLGVEIAPFRAANCGFDVDWSDIFRDRFAGAPLKSVTATSDAGTFPGEFVVTRTGIEGSLVYAHAAALRDRLESGHETLLTVDLAPGRPIEKLARDLAKQGGKASLSSRLRKGAGIEGVKAGLVRELAGSGDAAQLAEVIKALPIRIVRPRPIAEAISSAGGILLTEIDENYMLKRLPKIFVAGEMLDWEAPTGGYLLTACFAMGKAAAEGISRFLAQK
ncbi:putative flavoprotein (TIGR03862 family) [Pararhizobium capsulatum DSM 1112]|uniref:Flavoprotein (TIGR03862 family) n=1 Tax=Pararhizobium capsulatum DSM 1112 TaxID=1121113 RepID=A0ABU0BJV7_9HYPH|nr:TIGR03862 family flavoprotein [Pararhizobium capsulatum]MDQ0318173.1 putative flavoprotein (TIGR03862 family) [Pararhizobium capsulatum DSM 1112]